VRRMREELGFEVVVTAYGLTESCGVVSICRAHDSAERISHTSGCAMDGTEIKCVDREGRTVPPGTDGEIWCRGFNVMRHYFNNAAATAEVLTGDGWLRTGDVGVMDEDGYVRITGRIKEMFIVGGFNCYPAEIEIILCGMPGIARAAVIGVPDERLGEVARAYLVKDAVKDVVKDSQARLDEAAVIEWARDKMANYKVPRSVIFLEELPTNAGGKVDKAALAKVLAQARS
jgi:acyl-CoA synthetase (AMP-forming)/AMP-acid ligase II